jgi:hypothetical protein
MRAILSAPTADALGVIELDLLDRNTDLGATERRVQRVKTLDEAGYVVNDSGSKQCDRDIRLAWQPDETADARVAYLVETYATLHLSCRDGFFTVAPSRFDHVNQQSRLDLLVLARLAS